jgi:hypothetical protein
MRIHVTTKNNQEYSHERHNPNHILLLLLPLFLNGPLPKLTTTTTTATVAKHFNLIEGNTTSNNNYNNNHHHPKRRGHKNTMTITSSTIVRPSCPIPNENWFQSTMTTTTNTTTTTTTTTMVDPNHSGEGSPPPLLLPREGAASNDQDW